MHRLPLPVLLFVASVTLHAGPGSAMAPVDRSRLPASLRNVPLRNLSSGALMLLDHDGDLVRPPAPASATSQAPAASVLLDARINGNLRLGDDPSQLPSNMRAQAEPHIARAPTNPDLIVATFQEGRFIDGGAVDCGYSVTTDGGLSWTRALIPHLTQATDGAYFRATDPVAGVDLTGNIYLNTEGATDVNFSGGAILLSKSSDHGVTFGNPVVVFQPSNTNFPDKPWMAINTFAGTASAGRVLVTWTLFGNTSTAGGVIRRAYSDNGGASFSSSTAVSTSATNAQGSQPVYLPNSNVVLIYCNFKNPERIEAVISTDAGNTFGTAKLISNFTQYDEPSIRSGSILPSAAADRTSGNIFVVWQAYSGTNPRILFSRSTNGGANWSTPVVISDNPASDGVFNPAVNVSPDGQTVSVVFYDHRNNPGSQVLVDLYLAQSFDGGLTWQPNLRLTSTSTDASLAPLTSEGYMLGDYQGVAESTNPNVPAVPVWIDTRTGGADPFIARVGMAAQLNFASWQAARLSLGEINTPGIGGRTGDADGDGDGKANVLECALNTDPLTPDTIGSVVTQAGSTFSIIFPRLKSVADVSLHAFRSVDLSANSWTQINVTETLLSDDGVTQMWQASTPASSQMFMRLQAQ